MFGLNIDHACAVILEIPHDTTLLIPSLENSRKHVYLLVLSNANLQVLQLPERLNKLKQLSKLSC